MIGKIKDSRDGVTPVMSQAGVVPGPNASMKMGPPQATRGHPRSRYAKVRQRRRNQERNPKKKPDQPMKDKQQQSCLNILQWNASGIMNKKTEFAHLLSERDIHIALIQESQHYKEDPHITNYTHTGCTHGKNECQGLLTYIRNDVTGTVEEIVTDRPTDIHKISIWHEGSKYTLYNIYNPPWNDLQFKSVPAQVFQKTILAGDINGHSPGWGYEDYNKTGRAVEELCGISNLTLLQDKETPPTLLHRVTKKLFRPDLTMISSDLLNRYSLEVLADKMGSDHSPVLTSINPRQKKKFKRRTKWNFKKANWELYNELCNKSLNDIMEKEQTSVDNFCDDITKAILEAAAKSIPRGCRKMYKPFWTQEIQEAIDKRTTARIALEEAPTEEHKVAYNRECAKVKLTINTAKRATWAKTTAELDLSRNGAKAWSLMNNLNGENRKQNPKPMFTNNETIVEDQKKAEKMNKHFALIGKASALSDKDKEKLQDLKSQEKAPSAGIQVFEDNFTLAELNKAMKKLKRRKAPGEDKVHNEMLINLGETGRQAILCLFNMTLKSGTIPKAWRNAVISPILKKGKPQEDFNSYRPISMTSCLGKIIERMVNSRLYWWLESSGQLNSSQAGFRAGYRTEDQLFRLSQRVIDGFQNKHHTTAVFVDLRQAYDRVWRKGLLLKMRKTGIHGSLYKWLKSFLSERTIQTKVNNGVSSKEVLEEGLPQGSPLSCTLFLIFINDLPDVLDIEKALYADDLALWTTSKYTFMNRRRVNQSLECLGNYCEEWKLQINTSKTVYTVFTLSPAAAKENHKIMIQGKQLEKEENPTYLGIKLDPRLTLNEHMSNVRDKANNRLKLVKRLASTAWGADRNTLRQLYLGYVRSSMEYSLALQTISSQTTQQSIDKVQNHALRFISGGLKSTPTAACEVHTNVEPMRLRREAAVVETLERYHRQSDDHPNKKLVNKQRPKQRIKKKSILSVAEGLKDKYHMPEDREPIHLFDSDYQYDQDKKHPKIEKHLIENIGKKESNPLDLMNAALRTIDTFPDDWVHIYTDGSATSGTRNAGYGARVHYPDKTLKELSGPCGVYCTNYEAEATAMEKALLAVSDHFCNYTEKKSNIVIFTDALSVLQALENDTCKDKKINTLSAVIGQLINTHTVDITLQWIPGHVQIPGNDKADALAKQGAMKTQDIGSASINTAKQTIKQTKKKIWMKEWSESDKGRNIFSHMPSPNPNDSINKLKRNEQVTIFRLRSGHSTLNNHLTRIGAKNNPICPLCGVHNETVKHHLFECVVLTDLRREYLPEQPDTFNTLYGAPEALKKTHIFHVMANRRRASAQ